MGPGRAIALLLLAGQIRHRDTPDNPLLEEGVEYKNQRGSDKGTGIGQPALNVATLLDKDQAYPVFSV